MKMFYFKHLRKVNRLQIIAAAGGSSFLFQKHSDNACNNKVFRTSHYYLSKAFQPFHYFPVDKMNCPLYHLLHRKFEDNREF